MMGKPTKKINKKISIKRKIKADKMLSRKSKKNNNTKLNKTW